MQENFKVFVVRAEVEITFGNGEYSVFYMRPDSDNEYSRVFENVPVGTIRKIRAKLVKRGYQLVMPVFFADSMQLVYRRVASN